MLTTTIYQRAEKNGCKFVGARTNVSLEQWEKLMKGARKANRKKVILVALLAGIIDNEQAKAERKNPYFNPYNHWVTKTHVIYVHSAIEHFIEVQ